MEEKKKLALESEELSRLIGEGFSFEVKETEIRSRKKWFGLKKEYFPVEVVTKFKIEEPTLGTLDRLSAEWVQFAIDEISLKSKHGLQAAKTLTHQNALRFAKVVAIAVVGSSYLKPQADKFGTLHYVEDTERLAYLTQLFARTIKPSQLYQLCVAINTMSNLGDFCNSIRLMCAERTTNRIEENNED